MAHVSKQSAGILLFRVRDGMPEVLLVHPGGPFWAKKDVWFVPKGEFLDDEPAFDAAKREFTEELGSAPPEGEYWELGSLRNKSGKQIYAWAVQGDFDVSTLRSNTFLLEWPPKSGKQREFPEVDRAQFFTFADASAKINEGERGFITRLAERYAISAR